MKKKVNVFLSSSSPIFTVPHPAWGLRLQMRAGYSQNPNTQAPLHKHCPPTPSRAEGARPRGWWLKPLLCRWFGFTNPSYI